MEGSNMTTAIAVYNSVFAFLSGDFGAYDCRVPMFFGKTCRECMIKKFSPLLCCDGPCEVCGFEDCPHHGGKIEIKGA
jgi:hypothetical protein